MLPVGGQKNAAWRSKPFCKWAFVEPTTLKCIYGDPLRLLDFNQCDLPVLYGSFQEHSESSHTLNLKFSKPLHPREKMLLKIFWLKYLAFDTQQVFMLY